MARALGVSRSGYYAWARRPRREGDPWALLRAEVGRLWEGSGGRFGARSVYWSLPAGAHATPCRVRKLMRELGIQGIHPRSRRRTTVPDPSAPSRPDLIRRDFESAVPTTRLVGDITYLKTGEGWLYLAVVIDLATRMVVGWSMSERMDARLVVDAPGSARGRGFVAGGAISRSDRGSQYASRLLADWARANDVRLSVGRTGSRRDNAVAESFFGTLKNEMWHRRSFATRAEARVAVTGYIEAYYNRRRPHSTIAYKTPAQAMAEFFERFERAMREEPAAA